MSESPASETKQAATRVRYLIVFCATLMSFLLYLDRFCVSFAIDYIRQDLGLTQGDAKWFLSAFFWSYALAQVPAGWMSDRYGARIMLVIYILTWSLFTGLIGAASSFFILIATRLGCGLGQAGAYPTAASIVGRWIPVAARGTASGTVATGGRIGGAMAPVLTAYLIVLFVPLGTPVELTSKDVLINERSVATIENQLNSEGVKVEEAAYYDEYLSKPGRRGILVEYHSLDDEGFPKDAVRQFMFPKGDVLFVVQTKFPYTSDRSGINRDWQRILWNFQLDEDGPLYEGQ